MRVSSIRKFIGDAVSGFGFASIVFSDWFFASAPESSVSSDPSRGLLWPCYPKGVAWYYSAYTVTKSWDFVVFALLFFVGLVIAWRREPSNRKSTWPYDRKSIFAILAGAALSFLFFATGGEKQVVEWVMSLGVGPPTLPCFPMYAGVS